MDHIINPILNPLIFRGKRSTSNKSFIGTAYDYQDEKTKKVFGLEIGWKPNIRIRLFSVIVPIWILYNMLHVATVSAEVAINYGTDGFLIHVFILTIGILILEKLKFINKILRYIISFIINYVFDLGPSRNRNMTKNLIAELNIDNAISEIIVVTGSGHTKALAKILKTKYGFVQTGSYEPPGIYDS